MQSQLCVAHRDGDAARDFFTNDFDTETKGIDLVATYQASLFGGNSSWGLTGTQTWGPLRLLGPRQSIRRLVRQRG
jgi:hypothetical protein